MPKFCVLIDLDAAEEPPEDLIRYVLRNVAGRIAPGEPLKGTLHYANGHKLAQWWRAG